jgi:hypothetical protein
VTGFLDVYEEQYAPLLDVPSAPDPQYCKRAAGYRCIFERLLARKQTGFTLVETGCVRGKDRWGDGQSTVLFDHFARLHDGRVYSMELDAEHAAIASTLVSARCRIVVGDSVVNLQRLAVPSVDLLYLDSLDIDFNAPVPSQLHHLFELLSANRFLKPGVIVAVDDNIRVGDRRIGKGEYVRQWFERVGLKPLYDGYMLVWQMPPGHKEQA